MMKALVLKEYNRLEIEETPRPEIGAGDALIEVKACGICGSDVHGMDGSSGRRRPPIVMGHEASGVVAEVGEAVSEWKIGDRVTFDSTVYCGECAYCASGRVNLCDDRRVLGVSCEEYRRNGAFAQFVAVPERILYRLPDAVSFEQAAMVEPLSVAVHAVDRTPLGPGDAVVVVGVGMIGLLVVQALRVKGCGTIVAVDVAPEKLDLAKKLGADVAVNPDECDAAEEIRNRTGGQGADAAVEAVGVAPTVRLAVECLRKGGALTLVGNLAPQVDLPLQAVVTRELALSGSCASNGEYPKCLDLIASGKVDVDALISAVAPLSEGPEWFDRLYKKEKGLMKVILQP